MYEKENIQVIVNSVLLSDGVYSFAGVSSGDAGADVSGGNNGDTEQSPIDTVSSGDGSCIPGTPTVSGGDGAFQTTAPVDYTDSLVEIKEELTALSSLVFLLFIFLICTWTERKINGVVGKFTQWKKGR